MSDAAPADLRSDVARDLDWFFRRDGSMFTVSYASVPLEMSHGRGAVVAFNDIESRLRAEEELRERDVRLGEEQSSLRRGGALVAGGGRPGAAGGGAGGRGSRLGGGVRRRGQRGSARVDPAAGGDLSLRAGRDDHRDWR